MEKSVHEVLARRSAMTELIRNIRTVRNQLRTAKTFDVALFDQINGTDQALESLVGRDIFFQAMEEGEQTQLRREIMSKLEAQESDAFTKLRDIFAEYFSGFDRSLVNNSLNAVTINKVLDQADKLSDSAKKLIPGGTISGGVFSKSQVKDALFAMEKAKDFITAVTPTLERILSEHDDTEPVVTPGESTAAPAAPVEPNPEPTQTEIFVKPNEESDKDLTEIKATAEANISLAKSDAVFSDGGKMSDLGYNTVEDLVSTVKDIMQGAESYLVAAKALRDVLPTDTCVADQLGYGSAKFYDTYSSVVRLVAKCEQVRVHLASTAKELTAALKSVEEFSID